MFRPGTEYVGRHDRYSRKDGKIQAVREYMDTTYAKRMLFSADQAAA